jgi:methionyl-tRNA synthetase
LFIACLVASANRYIAEEEPWKLADEAGVPDLVFRLHNCLFNLTVALHVISECLHALLPATAEKIRAKFGYPRKGISWRELAESRADKGEAIFPK